MDASRAKDVKKGTDADEARRRRGEASLQLRKNKKEEGLAKRRAMRSISSEGLNEAGANSVVNGEDDQGKAAFIAQCVSERNYNGLMEAMKSEDHEAQHAGLRGFRRLLSAEVNPPVQECIDCGAIPYFVSMLTCADRPSLQFEAAWALTNIASTERTSVVVESGAVPHLCAALRSSHADTREQAAWCLGNVAGDGSALRDVVLQSGAMDALVANVAQPASASLLRNSTWALSNFCRGKPAPSLDTLKLALPVLTGLINAACAHGLDRSVEDAPQILPDKETVVDAAWALSYISDGEDANIQAVCDTGVVGPLVEMLKSQTNQMIVPALRTLGNIVSGSDVQTQLVIDSGALPAMVPLLSNPKKNIRKECCWMASNIAAGTTTQLGALAATPDMLGACVALLAPGTEWDVRKESAWVVSNVATSGTRAQLVHMVELGAIEPLCGLLDVGEVRIVLVALEALESLLKTDGMGAVYAQLVDEAGGVEKLENLQEHEDNKIYERAVSLLENFFGGEDVAESENMAPVVAEQSNTFGFGLPPGGTEAKPAFGQQFSGFGAGNVQQQQQQQQPGNVFNFA
jgi:hypothetical protein